MLPGNISFIAYRGKPTGNWNQLYFKACKWDSQIEESQNGLNCELKYLRKMNWEDLELELAKFCLNIDQPCEPLDAAIYRWQRPDDEALQLIRKDHSRITRIIEVLGENYLSEEDRKRYAEYNSTFDKLIKKKQVEEQYSAITSKLISDLENRNNNIIYRFESYSSSFIFNFIKYFASKQVPCGLDGNVEDRIFDCDRKNSFYFPNDEFDLVTVREDFSYVYRQKKSSRLFAGNFNMSWFDSNYFNVLESCRSLASQFSEYGYSNWNIPLSEFFETNPNLFKIPNLLTFEFYWTNERMNDPKIPWNEVWFLGIYPFLGPEGKIMFKYRGLQIEDTGHRRVDTAKGVCISEKDSSI